MSCMLIYLNEPCSSVEVPLGQSFLLRPRFVDTAVLVELKGGCPIVHLSFRPQGRNLVSQFPVKFSLNIPFSYGTKILWGLNTI